ncbi:MAG: ornithine cyclodeaminase [Clostridia bacterium]|nr:ornithine cyclodeaminase [Clostridia bacterium]
MKILTFEDIKSLNIDALTCYKWVEEGLKLKKDALLPAKISLKPQEGIFYNTMPVLLPTAESNYGGVKLVTRYPERNPSIEADILLYNLKNGKRAALMDGTWITTVRTGAVAAHSIKLFAKQDFSKIGLIGLGNTSRAMLTVLLSIYPNKKLNIKLKKYKEQHLLFAERFSSNKNITFSFCDNYEDVVTDSDVIVSAVTYFDGDICSDKCFKEGCLLVPIHTRGFTNCDLFFDKIFADDTNHVRSFKNFNKFKSFAEVADVVTGKVKGRENEKERIIAYNIGIALHDIYFAGKIYEMISNSECNVKSMDMDMLGPKEKFWL